MYDKDGSGENRFLSSSYFNITLGEIDVEEMVDIFSLMYSVQVVIIMVNYELSYQGRREVGKVPQSTVQ